MQTTLARDLFGKLNKQEIQNIETSKIDKNPALEKMISEFDKYLLTKQNFDFADTFAVFSKYSSSTNWELPIAEQFSAKTIAHFCLALPTYEHIGSDRFSYLA